MKQIEDVLKQKELELQQLQKEVEALRLTLQLLSTDETSQNKEQTSDLRRPVAVGAENSPFRIRNIQPQETVSLGKPTVMAPGPAFQEFP
jgi:TolA-binding protein